MARKPLKFVEADKSSNQTLETLKFVHEENRMAKVIRFSIETI